jgi:predicted nucleotidyltransferase component of viral defense system
MSGGKSNATIPGGFAVTNIKNIGASVRQKLLNLSRKDNRPMQELLEYYAMERFLYRLSCSDHKNRFILKGAWMLRTWNVSEARPTRDIDMLGQTSNEIESILEQLQDVIKVEVEPDGLIFDPASFHGERIKEDADYEGVRVTFSCILANAKIPIQIDIGFGDIVFPEPELINLPTILSSPIPFLYCYSMESAIAEKFEAMIHLRRLNSRMKDFYDIWILSRQFDFDGAALQQAIKSTLENRGTTIPEEIDAFEDSFIQEKQVQWKAFRKRLKKEIIPENFSEIVYSLKVFLEPIVESMLNDVGNSMIWEAPGPWKSESK